MNLNERISVLPYTEEKSVCVKHWRGTTITIIKKLQNVNSRFQRKYPKSTKSEKLVNAKSSNVGQNQLKKVKHRFCTSLLASPAARAARRTCYQAISVWGRSIRPCTFKRERLSKDDVVGFILLQEQTKQWPQFMDYLRWTRFLHSVEWTTLP